MPSADPRTDWKAGFSRRLGIYLVGIAIGLMVLGSVQRCKRVAVSNTTPPTTPTTTFPAAPFDGASSAPPS